MQAVADASSTSRTKLPGEKPALAREIEKLVTGPDVGADPHRFFRSGTAQEAGTKSNTAERGSGPPKENPPGGGPHRRAPRRMDFPLQAGHFDWDFQMALI